MPVPPTHAVVTRIPSHSVDDGCIYFNQLRFHCHEIPCQKSVLANLTSCQYDQMYLREGDLHDSAISGAGFPERAPSPSHSVDEEDRLRELFMVQEFSRLAF
jgi:hypothetical protein